MPAPYTLTLAPQIGVELNTIPTDQVKLTLLPVIQGVKGDKGDVVDLNAGTGITINYATATLAVDTSVIATKTYADTAANTALTSANTFTTSGLNTKADLVGGTVPANQLPSYVDDVLEYTDLASLPVTGVSGKIYVTLNTNLTYRWSGSGYVEISASLALGETASTAYRGDRGKVAYDHSQSNGNPHGTLFSEIVGMVVELALYAKKAVSNTFTAAQVVAPVALVSSATIAVNAATTNMFTLSLAHNATLSFPINLTHGQRIDIAVTNTGAFTLALDAKYLPFDGSPITIASGAGKRTLICGWYDSSIDSVEYSMSKRA